MWDDCTRFTQVYFLGKKSDTASVFESFLAEVQADGTSPAVMAVRSDNKGQFFGEDFGKLCHKRGIKQEFTPAGCPKYNDVAEEAHDSLLEERLKKEREWLEEPERCGALLEQREKGERL